MYLIDSSEVVDGVAQNSMVGPQMLAMFGIPLQWYNDSDKVELWGTSFKDGGGDYTLVKFYKGPQLIHEKRIEGY